MNDRIIGVKNWMYFTIAVVVFGIEVIIASFFHGDFIRNVLGDFFVVILIYAFFRAFTQIAWVKLAIGVLIFSYLVEVLQWVNVFDLLELERTLTTDLLLGSAFDWMDMLAYTFGVGFMVVLEKTIQESK